MPNANKWIGIGHLTRDPELKYTGSGTALCKCGIATSRKYKDKEDVCFVDLTIWGDQGERFNEWFGKGHLVYIEGRLEYRTWEAQDGSKRSAHGIVVEQFQNLRPRQAVPSSIEAAAPAQQETSEDIPF